MEFHFFVCSFCRDVQDAKTKKWNRISSFPRFVALYKLTKRRNGISFLRLFVLSRCTSRQNEETRKRRNGISFLRLFVLSRCTRRQNEEMESHFFVSSFCRVVQVDKTKKRENEEMEFYFFVSSFYRVVEGDKTNKHENEISKFHLFVYSFCRVVQVAKTKKWISFLRFVAFPTARRNDKTTKLPRNIKVWFVVVTCSFCRLFVLSTSTRRQNDRTTTRQNEVLRPFRFVALYKTPKRRNEISFWRLFVLSPSIRRQNEQTKWPYPASIGYPGFLKYSIWENRGIWHRVSYYLWWL